MDGFEYAEFSRTEAGSAGVNAEPEDGFSFNRIFAAQRGPEFPLRQCSYHFCRQLRVAAFDDVQVLERSTGLDQARDHQPQLITDAGRILGMLQLRRGE